MQRRARFGEIVLRTGLATEEQLRAARSAQAQGRGSLAYHLVERCGVSESKLVRGLARALALPAVSLTGKRIDPDVLELLEPEFAVKYGCLPLFLKAEAGRSALYLGVEDPTDPALVDDVSLRVGMRVRPVVVGPVELRHALEAWCGEAGGRPREEAASGDEVPSIDEGAAGADTAPMLVSVDAEERTAAEPPEKPRDVPTRAILRAVVGLLLDRDVFTRAELLEAVARSTTTDADS